MRLKKKKKIKKTFLTEHKSCLLPLTPIANILLREQPESFWISRVSSDGGIAFLEEGTHTVPVWPQAHQDPPSHFVHLYSSDVAASRERKKSGQM